jgi:lipid-A-disaccharide synthase
MARVLFVAGDPSGDERAAEVARELKILWPGVEISALGGAALRGVADRFLLDLVAEGVMGFLEPLKKIPRFAKILEGILRPFLKEWSPDVVVPTDFYGFNRFVARAAKDAGRRVVYYVSPQVWASRPGRVGILKGVIDRMLVLFPFEEKIYRDAGVPVTFVGHPLLDAVPEPDPHPPLRVEPVIGLLPGSRPSEVRRHLPLFLATADRLAKRRPGLRFVLFAAPNLPNDFYDLLLGGDPKRPYLVELVRDEKYQWRAGLDLALTCSGTATLENALLGLPMIVVYKTSWITYALARALVRVKHIAMPNVLAGREIVPEKIQSAATPEAIAGEVENLLNDASLRRRVRRDLLGLRVALGGAGAARRAAEAIKAEAQGASA